MQRLQRHIPWSNTSPTSLKISEHQRFTNNSKSFTSTDLQYISAVAHHAHTTGHTIDFKSTHILSSLTKSSQLDLIEHAAIKIICPSLNSLSNGDDMDAIYLDYAKAFDKVDHQLLLSKLQLYGFHSKIIRRIESFLANRSQQVIVDGHMSIIAPIISNVPQGTVLGPILFLIFINDIASCASHSTLRCFADDTRICRSISDLNNVHELQSDLEEVTKWSARNNMALHEDKFEYICHLTNKRNPLHQLPFAHEHFQYKTSTGTILTPVDQLRDLGITVSNDLSWTSHIRSSCDKARKMAAWVFSVFHTRNTGVMLTLYKSLVRSHLQYCSPLWNPSKICDIQELESVQRTFTSNIHGLQHLHYWERLKTLTLMSLQRRRERYVNMHMWKILHGLTSNDLQVQFTVNPRLGNLAKVPSFQKKISVAHQTLYETSFSVMPEAVELFTYPNTCSLQT